MSGDAAGISGAESRTAGATRAMTGKADVRAQQGGRPRSFARLEPSRPGRGAANHNAQACAERAPRAQRRRGEGATNIQTPARPAQFALEEDP